MEFVLLFINAIQKCLKLLIVQNKPTLCVTYRKCPVEKHMSDKPGAKKDLALVLLTDAVVGHLQSFVPVAAGNCTVSDVV